MPDIDPNLKTIVTNRLAEQLAEMVEKWGAAIEGYGKIARQIGRDEVADASKISEADLPPRLESELQEIFADIDDEQDVALKKAAVSMALVMVDEVLDWMIAESNDLKNLVKMNRAGDDSP